MSYSFLLNFFNLASIFFSWIALCFTKRPTGRSKKIIDSITEAVSRFCFFIYFLLQDYDLCFFGAMPDRYGAGESAMPPRLNASIWSGRTHILCRRVLRFWLCVLSKNFWLLNFTYYSFRYRCFQWKLGVFTDKMKKSVKYKAKTLDR